MIGAASRRPPSLRVAASPRAVGGQQALAWRITYLGADTPLGEITGALDKLSPAIVVIAAVTAQRFLDSADDIVALAQHVRVALAGAGASAALATSLSAESLAGELMGVAQTLTP